MPTHRECKTCNEKIPIEETTLSKIIQLNIKCPGCGGEAPKRTTGNREKNVMPAVLNVNTKRKEAVTVDISETGVKLFYLGKPIVVDSGVSLRIEKAGVYGRKCVVVWSHKAASTYSHSGLKFL